MRNPKQLTTKQARWLKHLRDFEASGQSLAAYAASHDLQPQHLYTWRSRLRALGLLQAPETSRQKRSTEEPARIPRHRRPPRLAFVPAHVAPEEVPGLAIGLRIRFPNGVWLEFGSAAEVMPDQRLLSLLAALP